MFQRQGFVEQEFKVGSREVQSWEMGCAMVKMALRAKGVRVPETWGGVELPDLINKNIRHPVKFKFQINKV